MKFEKQMKKHIDQVFEENVPNPYPTPTKQSRFPSWLKFVVPAGAVLAAASVATAIIVPNVVGNALGPISSGNGSSSSEYKESLPFSGTDCTEMTNFVFAPKNDRMIPTFDSKIVDRTGLKSLQKLTPYFKDSKNEDFVLSPATHLLCASALAAVSDGMDLDAFGLVDPEEDTIHLLEQWNCSYSTTDRSGTLYEWTRFDSAVLHQQVGGSFAFDPAKCQAVADKYIATSAANHSNYVKQAENYFKQAIGLDIPVPVVPMNGDGVLTYAALKMKDLAIGTYKTEKRDFYGKKGTIQVDYASIGSIDAGKSLRFFDGDNYVAFAFNNCAADMLIVLPDEGVPLEAVSLEEAYSEITKRSPGYRNIYCYVPYFHVGTYSVDITPSFTDYMNGKEVLWSKLLANPDVFKRFMTSFFVMQSSDFEFCEKGIFGESITVAGGSSAAMPPRNPLLIDVNRPFYAICLQDNFPLFINKVNNPAESTSIK